MNCQLFRIQKEFKGKDGKTHSNSDYYLEFENGEVISIQPKWTRTKNGEPNYTDFIRLRSLSELRTR